MCADPVDGIQRPHGLWPLGKLDCRCKASTIPQSTTGPLQLHHESQARMQPHGCTTANVPLFQDLIPAPPQDLPFPTDCPTFNPKSQGPSYPRWIQCPPAPLPARPPGPHPQRRSTHLQVAGHHGAARQRVAQQALGVVLGLDRVGRGGEACACRSGKGVRQCLVGERAGAAVQHLLGPCSRGRPPPQTQAHMAPPATECPSTQPRTQVGTQPP